MAVKVGEAGDSLDKEFPIERELVEMAVRRGFYLEHLPEFSKLGSEGDGSSSPDGEIPSDNLTCCNRTPSGDKSRVDVLFS